MGRINSTSQIMGLYICWYGLLFGAVFVQGLHKALNAVEKYCEEWKLEGDI
jgi:hypothetical protein